MRDDTKQYREDKALIDLVMRQRPLSRYRAFWACADIKRAGCGVLVKKDVEAPARVTRILVSHAKHAAHEEGRVLLLEFSSLAFLNVYAQNNGWTKESMAKRRAWDDELRRFCVTRKKTRRMRWAGVGVVSRRVSPETRGRLVNRRSGPAI